MGGYQNSIGHFLSPITLQRYHYIIDAMNIQTEAEKNIQTQAEHATCKLLRNDTKLVHTHTHTHTYLPPNSSNEVFILMTAIAVGKNGHFVLLTRGHIQHCYLVGLATVKGRREGERGRGREREG